MFGANIFHVPGQGLKRFSILEIKKYKDSRGRIKENGVVERAGFMGILAQAKQEERERWNQTGYPITHKIIMQGVVDFDVAAGDVLQLGERQLQIQGVYNPGELNHWTIFYCLERNDTGYETASD